jgi:hypothetical protein
MSFIVSRSAAAVLSCMLAAACSNASAAQDTEWPLELQVNQTKIVIYQPQPESLDNDRMSARAAVSVQEPGDGEPQFGAVWLDARIATDRDSRLVTILDAKVPTVKFPNATPEKSKEIAALLASELPKHHPTCSLDELLTTLDDADMKKSSSDGIQNAPPRIVFTTTPTVLITIDGKPQLQAVDNSKLMRVVNTPFVILFDPSTKLYYLRTGDRWAMSAEIGGPWQNNVDVPAVVKSALPPPTADVTPPPPSPSTSDSKSASESRSAPNADDNAAVLVVTEPTELIVSAGEPKWTPVQGNDLLYLSNSDSDVFMDVASQQYYVLLAGRWYKSPSLEKGPWTYAAADKLPAAFASIPPGSDHASVRTFVAGTQEARDAVLDASIPQTSTVIRSQAKCDVTYDGEPKFEQIAGTQMRYALNSSSPVIASNDAFYCCQQGVWFTATSPLGPWSVATSVPAEVHTIPPSCPDYPVRYVYVYDSTPEYVYVGYLPGYTGCYVYGPTIVYGTGFWYPGWYHAVYYPHPCTWGFGAYYNPWTCDWNYGASFGWGWSAGWFSLTFGWGHPGWWGPAGFHCNHFDIHGHQVVYHPAPPHVHGERFHHPDAVMTHVGHDNIYMRPENIAHRPVLAAHEGPAAARTHGASQMPNNVFVDHDGHVLRRTDSGSWEEHANDGWRPSTRVRGAEPARPGAGTPAIPRQENPPRPPARDEPPVRPANPLPRENERPVAPPARAPSPMPRETFPQRYDFERMHEAREQGSLRARGYSQRAAPSRSPSRPPGRQ